MLKSMTGFGRATAETESGEWLWELRSVNHRYLEMSLRVPEELRALEPKVRAQITNKLGRGKVEATCKFNATRGAVTQLALDSDALASLGQAIEQVAAAIPHSAGVDPLKVIQWPGVMSASSQQQDAVSQQVLACLDAALDDLVATREREGEKTAQMLLTRCAEIGAHIDQLREHRPAVVARQREKLIAKLGELDIDHNEHRLEQELVFVAQRLDIDEELDRLAAHVSEFEKAVSRKGPIGRRPSVDMKVLIEQMREQVQNIE